MHGNLFEWTHDWFEPFQKNAVVDPLVSVSEGAKFRSSRSGGWDDNAALARSAARSPLDPTYRDFSYGFRLALSLPVKQPEAK